MVVRLVNSLAQVNTQTANVGDVFVTPDGFAYELQANNQLGGFGSILKKIGQVALPVAGAALAPLTGGLSVSLSQAGAGLLGSIGSGGSGQAKGLAAINAYGQQVISALDSVLSSGQADSQILQAAQQIVDSLSDNSKVYQAKKGNDAAALAAFKSQAAAKLDQIRQLAQQTAQPQPAQQTAQGQTIQQTAAQTGGTNAGQVQQVGVAANGQPIYAVVPATQNAGLLGGIDTNTLLLIGGVIAVIYVFTK